MTDTNPAQLDAATANDLLRSAFDSTLTLPTTGVILRGYTLEGDDLRFHPTVAANQRNNNTHTTVLSDPAEHSATTLVRPAAQATVMAMLQRSELLDTGSPGLFTVIVDPDTTADTVTTAATRLADTLTTSHRQAPYPINQHIIMVISGWTAGSHIHLVQGATDTDTVQTLSIGQLTEDTADALAVQVHPGDSNAPAPVEHTYPDVLTDITAPVATDPTTDLITVDELLDRLVTTVEEVETGTDTLHLLDAGDLDQLCRILDNDDHTAMLVALTVGDPVTGATLARLLHEIHQVSPSHLGVVAGGLLHLFLPDKGHPVHPHGSLSPTTLRAQLSLVNAEVLSRLSVSDLPQHVFNRTIATSSLIGACDQDRALAELVAPVLQGFNPDQALSPLATAEQVSHLMRGRIQSATAWLEAQGSTTD